MKRFLLLVVVAVLAIGCPAPRPASFAPSSPTKALPKVKVSRATAGFRLSNDEGDDLGDGSARKVAATTALSNAETNKLLARLPPLAEEQAKAFALPPQTMPAPRPGKTIEEAFPPKSDLASPSVPIIAATSGPPKIERRAPEGDVPIAPQLEVTFDRTMDVATRPVKVTPEPPGEWRWLGAKTIVFAPAKRFPMATRFKVEVPALGVDWTFTTPPPKLVRGSPSGDSAKSEKRDPFILLDFDQDVDPARIAAGLDVSGVPVRLATKDEIEDAGVTLREKRQVAVKPTRLLAAATKQTVRLKAGTTGGEGPIPTPKDETFSFTTHGELRIVKHDCGYDRCKPLDSFRIEMSNRIDKRAFDKKMIKIVPDPGAVKVDVEGSTFWIHGLTKGKTKYTVWLAGALRDEHDQTLGRDESVTFDVGIGEPRLFGAEQDMIVLDPSSPRSYPLYSVNEKALRTKIYAVKVEDWPAYLAYARDWKHQTAPPGRVVFDKELRPSAPDDELATTIVDLKPALGSAPFGHAVLVVEGSDPKYPLRVWIQSTELALQAYVDPVDLTGWVTRIADGKAVEGAELSLLGTGSAKTDATGIARIPLAVKPGSLVFAKRGADTVLVPDRSWGETKIGREDRDDHVRWLVYDDRGMYKPGEEVHVKGWVRRAVMMKGGDLERLTGTRSPLVFTVQDPRGKEIAKGTTMLGASDGFDLAFTLPKDVNLGTAMVNMQLGKERATHGVEVQEFRRPEFEVKARASEGRHVVGAHAVATVEAAYYAGGGLPNAKVDWTVTRSRTSYSPPNHSDYRFGAEIDRWWDEDGDARDAKTLSWSAQTDGRGRHRLRVDFDPIDPPNPMSLSFAASVEDVNRARWSASTSMLVHPAEEYVGLRLPKRFVRSGDPLVVDVVVTDIDGHVVPTREATLRAARLEEIETSDKWEEKEVDEQTCASVTKTSACTFRTTEAGRYRVTADVIDSAGRHNQTTMIVWATGGTSPKARRGEEAEKVTLVPEKNAYQPGETASVLVVAPFAPAEGLLTVRRNGIVHLARFTMTTTTQTITVPLTESHVPNVELRVDLVGAKHATGSTPLKVLPDARRLKIDLRPRDTKLEPGGKTAIDVDVVDAKGKPVADAEVALTVADEAILALTNYRTPDPIEAFYQARGSETRELGMRDRVIVTAVDPAKLSSGADRDADGIIDAMDRCPNEPETYNGYQDHDGCPDRGLVMIEGNNLIIKQNVQLIGVRKNFSPLALWSPRVTTDAKGHATVPVSLPDNLTRYRVMAVAAAGERSFGSAESAIVARLPLMLRPSAPRFLRFGDRFELPLVVQNQTDRPMEVAVVARAANAVIEGPAGKKTTVPANDRVEIRFPTTTKGAGKARFEFAIASGAFADATQVELPVYTPATTEAFATYGEIDSGAVAQNVKLPPDVFPEFGGVEVTTSSTAVSALADAVLYLTKYPYECAEQIASRVMAIAALRDVLSAFRAEGMPSPEALALSLKADIEKLERMQHGSGGWTFWSGERDTWPILSIHVTHALLRAKEKGYAVDEAVLTRARDHLRTIEAHIPKWYGEEARRSLVAYALYVRKRMGDADPARAKKLVADAGGAAKLPIEALGWIWPTLGPDAEIRRVVANRVTETPEGAHFASAYRDDAWVLLDSDRRADAILLEAMIGDQPNATLIPKIVKGLLAHRKAGRWSSTQENAFVLLALDRYFATYEKTTPDFVARVWLGDRFAAEHAFRGRTTERSHVVVPFSFLGGAQAKDVVVAKDGPGRAYYRIGTQWASKDLVAPPIDRGFVVARSFEAVGAPDDVKKEANGTWRIKAGAMVRVRLSMVAPARRYHVALVDHLPAGLEVMNPALAITGDLPLDPKAQTDNRWWYWSRAWYEHENLRDDRVEAFASLLYPGVHEYTYTARATTPGTFIAGAPKAEEMYTPETYGRGATERVIVAE